MVTLTATPKASRMGTKRPKAMRWAMPTATGALPVRAAPPAPALLVQARAAGLPSRSTASRPARQGRPPREPRAFRTPVRAAPRCSAPNSCRRDAKCEAEGATQREPDREARDDGPQGAGRLELGRPCRPQEPGGKQSYRKPKLDTGQQAYRRLRMQRDEQHRRAEQQGEAKHHD